MSFGADSSNRVEAEAIDYARGAGVTMVAAGGNEGARLVMYPAGYPGVLGVGATDFDNKAASFSNRGSHIDVVAPGQGILSTYNGPKYTWTSGTSMSTAYVSAIAALAMSYSPGAGGEPLLEQIIATARDLGPEGRDPETGAGLVDPAALLQQLGAGRAPGMPRDIAATEPGRVARLTFTPAGGTLRRAVQEGQESPRHAELRRTVGEGAATGNRSPWMCPKEPESALRFRGLHHRGQWHFARHRDPASGQVDPDRLAVRSSQHTGSNCRSA